LRGRQDQCEKIEQLSVNDFLELCLKNVATRLQGSIGTAAEKAQAVLQCSMPTARLDLEARGRARTAIAAPRTVATLHGSTQHRREEALREQVQSVMSCRANDERAVKKRGDWAYQMKTGNSHEAELLHISPRTLQRMIQRKKLPAFKVGNQWRVKESHLTELM
jgi:excisionase family DNA binding protein